MENLHTDIGVLRVDMWKRCLRLITLKAKRQTFLTSKFLSCHSIGHVSHLDIIFFFCMIELLCGFLTCFDMTNTLLYLFSFGWFWPHFFELTCTKKNGFHSQYLVNTMKRNFLIKMIYNFFLPSLLMNFTFFTPLFPYTPLIPEIWLLILPLKITYKNLVLDHDDNFYLISLSILSTCLLNSVWILSERSQLLSLLGIERLNSCVRNICTL